MPSWGHALVEEEKTGFKGLKNLVALDTQRDYGQARFVAEDGRSTVCQCVQRHGVLERSTSFREAERRMAVMHVSNET